MHLSDAEQLPAAGFPDACRRAQTLIDRRELAAAAEACVKLVQTYPDQGNSWQLLSLASLNMGRLTLAVDSALQSLNCSPQNPTYLLQLAKSYIAAGDWQQARKALDLTESHLQQPTAIFLDTLGVSYYRCNELDKALNIYNRAIKIEPDYLSSYYNKATVLRFKGRTDEAEAAYRHVITARPNDYEACYNLAQLRRQTRSNNVIALLTNAVTLCKGDWQAEVQLDYGLGKVYEELADYKQAFNHYSAAATRKRQHLNYNVNDDIALMDELTRFFTAMDSQPSAPQSAEFELSEPRSSEPQSSVQSPQDSPQPIFVVGLPRTGTTLVERIVSSHPDVEAGGELNSLPIAILEAGGKSALAGPSAIDSHLINTIKQQDFSQLGKRYSELTQSWMGQSWASKASRFVDKLPFNFLYCGFIHHALPQAKIIHVVRHPLDTGLSNFKMLFKHGYEYSYDLHELATYINAYQRLMKQWHRLYPGAILDISYEALVDNQQRETKRILEHCNLPWDTQCLDFHHNKAACQTASASQVREPVYSSSIESWQHFQQQLTPLINTLSDLDTPTHILNESTLNKSGGVKNA